MCGLFGGVNTGERITFVIFTAYSSHWISECVECRGEIGPRTRAGAPGSRSANGQRSRVYKFKTRTTLAGVTPARNSPLVGTRAKSFHVVTGELKNFKVHSCRGDSEYFPSCTWKRALSKLFLVNVSENFQSSLLKERGRKFSKLNLDRERKFSVSSSILA